MPELPEVEINRRNLEAWLGRRRVADAHVAPTWTLVGLSLACSGILFLDHRELVIGS